MFRAAVRLHACSARRNLLAGVAGNSSSSSSPAGHPWMLMWLLFREPAMPCNV
jgi:hypothetical protein